MKTTAAILVAAGLGFTATAAGAQNFLNTDITQMYNQMAAQQQAQMAAQQQQMIQQILRDPKAMALYPTCGRGLTKEQFAYKYAATGGCSPQGYQNYNNTTNQIGAQQRAAMDQYYRSIEQSRQAYNAYAGGYAANQQEAGRVMGGAMTYTDSATGKNVQLNYLQPGQSYTDPKTHRTYAMDAQGQYWSSNGNGTWAPVRPAAQAPRR